MAKDAYYFSHDSNASRDPKCAALRASFGAEGYGVFWMMIETLAEQNNYKLEKFPKLYEGLSKMFQVEVKQCSSIIEAMLKDYHLLVEDDKYIWSESLIRRMDEKDKKKQQKIEAGRLGGIHSALNRKRCSSGAQAVLKQPGSESNQSKLNKSKLNKKDIYGELKNVFLTKEEYEKLKERFNSDTENRINQLSTYIASKGDKYKSHYATILSWAQKDEKQKVIQKVNDGW